MNVECEKVVDKLIELLYTSGFRPRIDEMNRDRFKCKVTVFPKDKKYNYNLTLEEGFSSYWLKICVESGGGDDTFRSAEAKLVVDLTGFRGSTPKHAVEELLVKIKQMMAAVDDVLE